MEIKREEVLGLAVDSFMSINQFASYYKCKISHVRQNVIKVNAKGDSDRVPLVDFVELFPADIAGLEIKENKQYYIICNSLLRDYLTKREQKLGTSIMMFVEANFKFID